MKKLLSALLCLFSVSAFSQSRITADITITNQAVTSNSIVINGAMRFFTNATTSTTIATNLTSINATKTNLFNQIAAFPANGVALSDGNTNSANSASNFTLRGAFGGTLTVSVTGSWAHVQMHTQAGSTTFPVLYPMDNVTGNTNRTNSASDLVAGFSKYSTNAFTTNSTAVSNLLVRGASPQQYVSSPVQFNGTLRVAAAGAIHASNGFLHSVTGISLVTTSLVNYGSAVRSEGSGGNSLQVGSNALAKGSHSMALGNGSLASNLSSTAIGQDSKATNDYAVSIGRLAESFGASSTALGAAASATNSAVALGQGAAALGESSIAVGAVTAVGFRSIKISSTDSGSDSAPYSIALGDTALGSAVQTIAIGSASIASHSNSAAIGPPDHAGTATATTETNQIRLGTPGHVVSVPGFYQGTASNLVTAAGQTNVFGGDLSTPRAAVTTIANGANRFSMGTNIFIDLTGSPSSAGWSVDGIIFGAVTPRDGHTIRVRNGTGYDATFVHNSGLEATAAYRISTATATNVIFTNAACADLIYSASASRWLLWNVFSGHTLTASATNAIGYLDGSGTNLNLYQTAANVALTINPLIGAGGSRFVIKDTNGNAVVYVDTNNVFTASNALIRGGLTNGGGITLTNPSTYIVGKAGATLTNYSVGGTVFVNATPIASAGTAATNLMTWTMPGHLLTNIFDRARVTAYGVFSSPNTKQVYLALGSQTLVDSLGQTFSGGWQITADIVRTGNTSQTINGTFIAVEDLLNGTTASYHIAGVQTNGIDTVLRIVADAAAANGEVTNTMMIVEYFPAPK